MKVTATGKSDIGLVRKKNQDAFGLFPELGLYIVADGMGGQPAGEIASQMTVDRLYDFFSKAEAGAPSEPPITAPQDVKLHEAICYANKKVFESALANPAYYGMGTTVVVLWADPPGPNRHDDIRDRKVWIGFVGDSRAYRHRNGTLTQITQDHSVVNEYIRMGVLTPEAARHHPHKHVMSRGVGVALEVLPETFTESAEAGDLFLLCTDGLSNLVEHEAINAIVTQAKEQSLETVSAALIEEAKKNGGRDNITVVLVACGASP